MCSYNYCLIIKNIFFTSAYDKYIILIYSSHSTCLQDTPVSTAPERDTPITTAPERDTPITTTPERDIFISTVLSDIFILYINFIMN